MSTLRDRRIWELTQVEFIKLASKSAVPKRRLGLKKEINRQIEHTKKIIKERLLIEILNSKCIPPDIFERTNGSHIAAQTHFDEVKRALQAGWPVPWRAVKDYKSLLSIYRNTRLVNQPILSEY